VADRPDDRTHRGAAVFTDLAKKEEWQILLALAHEYAKFAKAGLNDFSTEHWQRGRSPLCVIPVLQALRHAVELFLKAGILWGGARYKTHHDLTTLLRDYDAGTEDPGLRFRADVVERLTQWDEAAKRNAPSQTAGTALRYLHDRNGNLVYAGLAVSVEHVARLAEDCDREFARIHVLMIQLRSQKPETHLVHPLNTWWEPEDMYEARCEEAIKRARQRMLNTKPAE